MSSDAQPPVERATIRAQLDNVYDPELDRSIVELEYIDDIRVDSGRVVVEFVLPTAWCSPAFAWMMATGIRDEISALPTVEDVHVELLDHMHDDQINRGVNEECAFHEAFEDADADLETVRRKLDHKARLVRQHDAVEHLLDAGLTPEQIVGLTSGDLATVDGRNDLDDADRIVVYLRDSTVGVPVSAALIRQHLEKAREVGLVTDEDDPLFANTDGEPVDSTEFDSVHRETRLARTNMSGQAGICLQLHEARNGAEVVID